jgi:hypothetical protein
MEESHVGVELDRRLRDDEAMDEIEMTSNLMIAASEVDGGRAARVVSLQTRER